MHQTLYPEVRKRYKRHLSATMGWLERSLVKDRGGSAAYFIPGIGWSKAYPETTGYIIPTLLCAGECAARREICRKQAIDLGNWLCTIQNNSGYWMSGLHPPTKDAIPSVFNTAQVLKGMVALFKETGDAKWLSAASRGASWLESTVDKTGLWSAGHYAAGYQPSYYTRVAWPMLEVWALNGDESLRQAAQRVLDRALNDRLENGAFGKWSFQEAKPAFTHTIAYTLRGFLESARLLNLHEAYAEPTFLALEVLLRRSELSRGRLSGTFDCDWRGDSSFACLTGCSQIAICLLIRDEIEPDLRLVNCAAKLVDFVCSTQMLGRLNPLRGAVAGSRPFWGKYMMMRYPNWAAKFHADALMRLVRRLDSIERV